jgi:hypothetical protein
MPNAIGEKLYSHIALLTAPVTRVLPIEYVVFRMGH